MGGFGQGGAKNGLWVAVGRSREIERERFAGPADFVRSASE